MQALLERTRDYHKRDLECLMCLEARAAVRDDRLVFENERVVMYTRDRSRFSSSLVLQLRTCSPSWLAANAVDFESWAATLGWVTRGLRAHKGGVPFNLLQISESRIEPGYFHWHTEIVPRYFTLAGFELLTGNFIRTQSAQEAARGWRQMLAPLDGPI